jgi:zinc finger HIT domain-containing protein 1
MATEAPKRSTRERKASSKVRVFDQNMRNEIKRKRLDSLEADNWHEERRTVEEADDDDYNPLDDASSGDEVAVAGPKRGKSKKKKQKKDVWNATQKCKSLQEILDEAEYHKYPSWVPNYASIAAAPSRYPPRHFCSVTGLMGKYKCPVTGDYLATMDAYTTHRETRLKGTPLPPPRTTRHVTVASTFSGTHTTLCLCLHCRLSLCPRPHPGRPDLTACARDFTAIAHISAQLHTLYLSSGCISA